MSTTDSKNSSDGSKTEKKSPPIHEVRIGAIKCTIWANPTKGGGTMHNTTITRIYKDADGNWQETGSLGRDDLLIAQRVLGRVFDYLTTKETERTAS